MLFYTNRWIKANSYSLLVTRVSPFAEATGDKPHPPSRGARHPPPDSTHANSVCAGPGGGGHSYDRCDELFDSFHSCAVGIRPPRPAGTPPQRGTLFRNGTGATAISVVKGNLDRGGNVPSSPPLEGWRDTGPRATCRVGGWDGVVRDCGISYLLN